MSGGFISILRRVYSVRTTIGVVQTRRIFRVKVRAAIRGRVSK